MPDTIVDGLAATSQRASELSHPALQGIALVAFDLDGTLIDSVPDLAHAVDLMLEDEGLSALGETRVRDFVGNGSRVLVERALQAHGRQIDDIDMVERAHHAFMTHYAADPSSRTRLYSGARECLDGLHRAGLSLALITNKPEDFIAPLLEHFSLAEHFVLALGGDTLPTRKPDPAPLLFVAERLGVTPNQALMVGDSRHDIAAGKAAGFRTLAVPYGYNHGDPISASQPDYLVESLAALVATY
ncbi:MULTISPECIES: phosphoglycolate phosphatase [Cobetia]|uniref:phosphoglycolate phosphatase n=1 Tax=Cobetia TaxID=204286 RepID=UPI0004686CA0|nr:MULTISPECIES: phosphoglycolate phosphatase [Cobetia]